ncbi:methyltransferase domain protein [Mariprofundus micogutta]|uniref:Methyltransferase domain protein n=1 Tax=Mariprofundus micogutta TaxID=1921010 RepID=A0A1L8CQM0_9PROT|nr:class I SAM-dependent methyltransferase [Mariprofundus micogutta]GAV21222.1 methyltransferase domain protein [Mariprofundus micogutta]
MRRVYLPFGESDVVPGMDAGQRKEMIERHRDSVSYFGYSSEALYWESRGGQKIRFEALAEIGIRPWDSLLDVGCGFGDLYSWLNGKGLPVDYTGIDLSPDILAKGLEMNPGLKLLQGEVFDFDWAPESFDWIVLSGTLNWDLHDDGEYAMRVIDRMFKLCRNGVAFNMLDHRNIDAASLLELIAYDVDAVFSFCKKITPACQLRTDYLADDFTIYMRRSEQA